MRRLLIGVTALLLVFGSSLPAAADPANEARRREGSLRAALKVAAQELENAEQALYQNEAQLAFSRQRLAAASQQLAGARTAIGDEVRAMYQSGRVSMTDALFRSSLEQMGQRLEFFTVLVTRQADVVAQAEATRQAYTLAARQVAADRERATALRARAKAAVDRLTTRLREAERATARLRAAQTRASSASAAAAGATTAAVLEPGSRGFACPMAPPYTYVDSWGAARSGGRTHEGTDIMAPYGAKVLAFTGGVISRQKTGGLGGITLYLQGDNGAEYYYAHLSGYAVGAGARVRAGQHIAFNGNSGNASATAPHVHFEIHPGGPGSAPVNPYSQVRQACG
jgi:murein DD-endopeptidase MepM/ murein hydrolase activator NlpD